MPVYVYKHPKTGEEFEEIRSFTNMDKPFIAEDGVKCKRVLFPMTKPDPKKGNRSSRAGKKLECFEADPGYVRKMNPKTIKFNDGHVEKYNPNKHC